MSTTTTGATQSFTITERGVTRSLSPDELALRDLSPARTPRGEVVRVFFWCLGVVGAFAGW